MLNVFPGDDALGARTRPIWVDLCNPSPTERAEVELLIGVGVPTREHLSEIESSSRLRARDGVLSMSIPMTTRGSDGEPVVAPVGFVLSRDRLLTVRFATLHAFDEVTQRFKEAGAMPTSSREVFVELCEEIVDGLADNLEQVAAELRTISVATFDVPEGEGPKAVRSTRIIRSKLRHIGRLGDRASEARDTLLGVGRAVDFAGELTRDWDRGELEPRMKSLRQDVVSLDDYEVHLSEKVQFLLDAMVGLIGIAQNEIFKTLTIVSIVGIPPTLMAGIYGMNFKYMPELGWSFGYPYGLAVIALSAIVPLVWFKVRGWF
ncbi:MAG: magnesium transporter CorA family protein [Methylovirgula sp.]|jgi:magnesium transporter